MILIWLPLFGGLFPSLLVLLIKSPPPFNNTKSGLFCSNVFHLLFFIVYRDAYQITQTVNLKKTALWKIKSTLGALGAQSSQSDFICCIELILRNGDGAQLIVKLSKTIINYT